jgi:hypothetical protein
MPGGRSVPDRGALIGVGVGKCLMAKLRLIVCVVIVGVMRRRMLSGIIATDHLMVVGVHVGNAEKEEAATVRR